MRLQGTHAELQVAEAQWLTESALILEGASFTDVAQDVLAQRVDVSRGLGGQFQVWSLDDVRYGRPGPSYFEEAQALCDFEDSRPELEYVRYPYKVDMSEPRQLAIARMALWQQRQAETVERQIHIPPTEVDPLLAAPCADPSAHIHDDFDTAEVRARTQEQLHYSLSTIQVTEGIILAIARNRIS